MMDTDTDITDSSTGGGDVSHKIIFTKIRKKSFQFQAPNAKKSTTWKFLNRSFHK